MITDIKIWTNAKRNECRAFQTDILKNIGTLEYWNIGILEHWNIGTLECWNIGMLEQQYIYLNNPLNIRMNV
ncbi:MAG: hypothetical protein LBQ28_05430 [Prevotellaceae bacterium]|nr:hypothetical protein [Prevotellaceae bacterium]